MEFYLIFVECVLNSSAAWSVHSALFRVVYMILFPVYSCSFFRPRFGLNTKKKRWRAIYLSCVQIVLKALRAMNECGTHRNHFSYPPHVTGDDACSVACSMFIYNLKYIWSEWDVHFRLNVSANVAGINADESTAQTVPVVLDATKLSKNPYIDIPCGKSSTIFSMVLFSLLFFFLFRFRFVVPRITLIIYDCCVLKLLLHALWVCWQTDKIVFIAIRDKQQLDVGWRW